MTAQQTLTEQEEALARVASVQGRLTAHSIWSEQACRLHDDSFAAIVEARIPRLFLPTGLGGDEVNPRDLRSGLRGSCWQRYRGSMAYYGLQCG